MNKEEMLTYEMATDLFRYEPLDGTLWWAKRRNGSRANLSKPIGAKHQDGHLLMCMSINAKKLNFYVHRVIWLLEKKEWPSAEVDHINGNPTDNRIENLRLATRIDNARNSARNKKHGLCKGVFMSGEKFRARLWIGKGKSIDLGSFAEYEDAKKAFVKEAAIWHGDFLRLEKAAIPPKAFQ